MLKVHVYILLFLHTEVSIRYICTHRVVEGNKLLIIGYPVLPREEPYSRCGIYASGEETEAQKS